MLLGVGFAIAAARSRTSRRPRTSEAHLVGVPGQVLTQHPFTLRWTISYPLPDGTPGDLQVERTLPEMLREGMPITVLIDPADPRRARLDVPERAHTISSIRTGVMVSFVFALVVLGLVIGVVFSLG